jgi:hypothetical protein
MATYAKYADIYKNRTRSQDSRVISFIINIIYRRILVIHKIYHQVDYNSQIVFNNIQDQLLHYHLSLLYNSQLLQIQKC